MPSMFAKQMVELELVSCEQVLCGDQLSRHQRTCILRTVFAVSQELGVQDCDDNNTN